MISIDLLRSLEPIQTKTFATLDAAIEFYNNQPDIYKNGNNEYQWENPNKWNTQPTLPKKSQKN